MTRPSHWVLPFLIAATGAAWFSGLLERRGAGPTKESGTELRTLRGEDPTVAPTVVTMPRQAATRVMTVHLRGRVVDPFGWPVANAAIEDQSAGTTARTDPAGWFELNVDPTVQHRLTIAAQSYRTTTTLVQPEPGHQDTLSPVVVALTSLAPWETDVGPTPDRAIRHVPEGPVGEGFARLANGEPASHAVVTVVETGDSVRADALGRFRVPLPSSPAVLLARDANGRAAIGEPVTPARTTGLVPVSDLRLTKASSVIGRIRDNDGKPCAEAPVTLRGSGIWQRTLTDVSGFFAFIAPAAGRYELCVLPNEGRPALRKSLDVAGDQDLELVHTKDTPLRVRVVDGGMRPQPQVNVVAASPDLKAMGRADDEGEVTLRGLREGPFTFEVRDAERMAPMEILAFDSDAGTLMIR